MSQREAAERARQEALEAAQAKPLHPAVKMGLPIIAFIVAAIAAIALIVQIAGASGHREDVAHRADELKTQAQTAEAEARESHSEMVSSVVGTDMVRLDTDASALESLLLESGTVTMGKDVDSADVSGAQAYIEESGTKDPEVETLITGIEDGSQAEPGDQDYRTTVTLPEISVEVVVHSSFAADGSMTAFDAQAHQIITSKEG